MTSTPDLPPLPEPFVPLYGDERRKWADQMRAYGDARAAAAVLAERADRQCSDDDGEGGNCNVCGGRLRYGGRHRQCGEAVMAAEKAAVLAERERANQRRPDAWNFIGNDAVFMATEFTPDREHRAHWRPLYFAIRAEPPKEQQP